jgi:predicted PurR-regulated permease PerM
VAIAGALIAHRGAEPWPKRFRPPLALLGSGGVFLLILWLLNDILLPFVVGMAVAYSILSWPASSGSACRAPGRRRR